MASSESLTIRERPTGDACNVGQQELSGDALALQIKAPPSPLPVGEVRRLPIGPVTHLDVDYMPEPPSSDSTHLPMLLNSSEAVRPALPQGTSPKAAIQHPSRSITSLSRGTSPHPVALPCGPTVVKSPLPCG